MAQRLDVKYIQVYTQGSAARKLAPAFPVIQPKTVPEVYKRKKILVRVDPVALLGILVAISMVICMGAGIGMLNEAKQEQVQMQAYVSRLSSQNQQLYETYESGYDLQVVEQTARALGMVSADQVQHVDVTVSQETVQEEESNTVEQFVAFLTGLFA